MATVYWNYGRLGNQMHQIAAAYALSLELNEPCEIPPWEYSKFFPNYNDCIVTIPEVSVRQVEYQQKWEDHWQCNPIRKNPNQALGGWFESTRYFEGYESEVRELFFQPGDPVDATAIHVRRTDLFTCNRHVILSDDYYIEAVGRAGWADDRRHFVFSDDVAWCKQHFCSPCYEFPDGSVMEDFMLMRRCERLVMANSTMSWWAGYLNPGQVIAPRKWWKDKPDWWKTVGTTWTLI